MDVVFAVPFLCYFQKPLPLVIKNFEIIFVARDFYLHELKKCQFFFQTGDINIFVLLAIFFNRYVQLKSSFCPKKKASVVESETLFSREAIRV